MEIGCQGGTQVKKKLGTTGIEQCFSNCGENPKQRQNSLDRIKTVVKRNFLCRVVSEIWPTWQYII